MHPYLFFIISSCCSFLANIQWGQKSRHQDLLVTVFIEAFLFINMCILYWLVWSHALTHESWYEILAAWPLKYILCYQALALLTSLGRWHSLSFNLMCQMQCWFHVPKKTTQRGKPTWIRLTMKQWYILLTSCLCREILDMACEELPGSHQPGQSSLVSQLSSEIILRCSSSSSNWVISQWVISEWIFR